VILLQPVSFDDFEKDTIISSESDLRKREMFHRQALFSQDEMIELFKMQRDELEAGFVSVVKQIENPAGSQGKVLDVLVSQSLGSV
jgi:hypothetical protein